MSVFFFFQAEDGIRDLIVTGVQTCALPICVLRRSGKPLLLAVNKLDGVDEANAMAEFSGLGFAAQLPLSAANGRGVPGLVEELVNALPAVDPDALDAESPDDGIRVAIIGRP